VKREKIEKALLVSGKALKERREGISRIGDLHERSSDPRGVSDKEID
jgi:hypothetical protein